MRGEARSGAALKTVQQELAKQKLSLKMLDCYRPARAVARHGAWARDGKETPAQRRYNPALPQGGSVPLGLYRDLFRHSTGAALDLTLVDLTAGNSATRSIPKKTYADCTAPRRAARARRQHRYGHRLRLLRRQGAYTRSSAITAGAAQLAQYAGGGDGEAGFCELFQGVVALFAAGRWRAGL